MRRFWPAVVLILVIVVPYWRLATMQSIIVTDDRIVSDVYHAELPGRVEMARLIHAGELPTWTPRLCTGMPLIAGVFPDPLSLLTFGLLPTVAAVNVFLLITLIVAALGTHALARRFGASELGGLLAGVSFSWSGYMVCQLKHLGIVSVVCWLPVGLWLLDRALEEEPRALFPFALVVALQWVSNFPQSAYICSLVYAGFALCFVRRRWRLVAATAVAIALGIACAAVALLPLRELASTSERSGGVTWTFATMLPYSPYDIFTFFLPYANGDASDNTYRGSGLFWENYGYVGLLTTLIAIYAALVVRTVRVAFLVVTIVVAYLIVLGPATPVFKLLFHAVPGMSSFRFPTRFLVVVDLGLSVLGGLGLTHLAKRTVGRGIGVAVVALTTADLVFHHRRQNPLADARAWMTPPSTATYLQGQPGRIYTPLHYVSHLDAHAAARGWSDLSPYYRHRELIQPNTNVLWGLDTCDCYAGLMPATSSVVWGRSGTISGRFFAAGGKLEADADVWNLLARNGVRHVLSTWKIPALREEFHTDATHVYALDGERVTIEGGSARIVAERPRDISIDATAAAPTTLILADQIYPGWHATVDDVEVPIFEANGRHRAVHVPAGQHRVRFTYRSESLVRGAWISTAALLTLLASYVYLRRRTSSPRRSDDRSGDDPSRAPA